MCLLSCRRQVPSVSGTEPLEVGFRSGGPLPVLGTTGSGLQEVIPINCLDHRSLRAPSEVGVLLRDKRSPFDTNSLSSKDLCNKKFPKECRDTGSEDRSPPFLSLTHYPSYHIPWCVFRPSSPPSRHGGLTRGLLPLRSSPPNVLGGGTPSMSRWVQIKRLTPV